MKAMQLESPAPIQSHPLIEVELERPRPAPRELLIRVSACGVCRTDLHVVEGELDRERQKSPIIPGHQVVGTIEELGSAVTAFAPGDRVGVPWLHCTCEACRFCSVGRENLCETAEFTGWTRDGGYAEFMVASAPFAYRLPEGLDDLDAAPMLCAGIIGYRCLRQCDIEDWSGARLGLYGFGAAAHIAIQVALARGAEVYVFTRDREKHMPLAEELGAEWVGDNEDQPDVPLDASIIFAPAGRLVPLALKTLDRGGRLVLGGIHMSPIEHLEYQDMYFEREIKTVANNTREDGRAFLKEAARIGVRTHIEPYPLHEANEALVALKDKAIRGAAVLTMRC